MKTNKQNAIVTFYLALLCGLFSIAANAAPPSNDFWGDASIITGESGTVSGTVVEATKQTCELDHIYPEGNNVVAKRSVWYKWLAPANGSYTFRIASANGFDTTLSAYRFTLGLCNQNVASIPTRIIENHDYNANLGTGDKSRISFRAFAGEVIHIAVDSYLGSEGTFTLGWGKTKFRYSAQLDYNNGGTDLNITRAAADQYTEIWTARYGESTTMNLFFSQIYGRSGDKRFFADYDGDGVSELVAVRPTNGKFVWWIANRVGVVQSVVQFGLDTDHPVVGDYDGDGIADIAVARDEIGSKTWHILRSSNGQHEARVFGSGGEKEMVGDYDGDGKTDLVTIHAVFPEATYEWRIQQSSDGTVLVRRFGKFYVDVPQVADFDSDGKTDITMFRRGAGGEPDPYDGYWFSLDSSSPLPIGDVPTRFQAFGQDNDIPQAGDYDGDGVTDLAIFRGSSGHWWIRKSTNGQSIVYKFGATSDIPRADTGIAVAFMNLNL